MSDSPYLIVGGGTIGLALGWTLARRGAAVTLIERGRAGRGTSWQAAGMLAPDAEIGFEELDLYRLSRESLRRWPAFVDALESAADMPVDYRDDGTLIVADDPDSEEALRRLYDFQQEHGLNVTWCSGAEAREIEPFLAPRLAAAIHAPMDHQVDNRLLVDALRTAFKKAGGTLHEHTEVEAIHPDKDAPRIRLTDGNVLTGQAVVVAAGVWSRELEGWTPEHTPSVRPVKGQMLQCAMQGAFELSHVIRGPDAYLAPKSNGRLVIGATSEERGFDTTVTAGGLYDILEGAWEVVPGIYDLPVDETWAGLRPASRDHAPLLGPSGDPGIWCATGHYRHGILLTPITAQEMARQLLDGETSDWIEPFLPSRLHSPTVPTP